jgi:predicted transcriptional regulator
MESADERARRLEHEVPRIKAALESVAAGRVVPLEAVDAWIESLGTDHELPAPRAKR